MIILELQQCLSINTEYDIQDSVYMETMSFILSYVVCVMTKNAAGMSFFQALDVFSTRFLQFFKVHQQDELVCQLTSILIFKLEQYNN